MMATGLDASTKLGAYVSLGCITPRQIHSTLEASEDPGGRGMEEPEEAASKNPEVDAFAEGAACLKMHLQIRLRAGIQAQLPPASCPLVLGCEEGILGSNLLLRECERKKGLMSLCGHELLSYITYAPK